MSHPGKTFKIPAQMTKSGFGKRWNGSSSNSLKAKELWFYSQMEVSLL